MPSNKDQVDEILEALQERVQWENELARGEAQRKCMDRAKVNNTRWNKCSNVRYPLSDTLISQFTPFLFKILYSSERVAYFKPTKEQNAEMSGIVADWFDNKVKSETDLEDEIQPCADKWLQDGETVMKILWNEKKEFAQFEYVDNLFFITPSTTLRLEDAPWCVHVLQKSKKWILKRFKDVPGIEEFVARVCESRSDSSNLMTRDENEYRREGISISPKNGNLLIYEKHFKDEKTGKCRIKFLSPDDPSFEFGPDFEYTHDLGGYMFEHSKFEKISKKMHDSRGLPRLVMEGEFTLTALERFLQDSMTLTLTPMLYAQGPVPSGTQNLTWQMGTILPMPIGVVPLGQPGFEIQSEIQRTREKWERRVGSPDYGIGKSNTQNDSRTATEVKAISFQQSQAVDIITGNWRMFLGKVFRKAWKYCVEANKITPLKSLSFFVGGKAQQLQSEMLNDGWEIAITGSAESVNRETMTQKAITLWQMSQNNQFANLGEAWKNVLQNLIPGEVDRFYQDPAERQQTQVKKTASDISVIVATDYPMVPDQTDDLSTAAMTAMQFLMAAGQKGKPLTPQQVKAISQYISVAREGLKKQNPQAYAQLNQALNQMDIQSRQQAEQLQAQQAQQLAQQQAQLAPPPEAPPENVMPIPTKKQVSKTITLLRNPDGSLRGARVIGIEDIGGTEVQGDQKNILFEKNPDGRIVGAQVDGVENA